MPSYFPKMRQGYRIFGSLLAILIGLILGGCQQTATDDKALIRQRLQEMVKAVENRQTGGFLEGIHKDFLGQGTLRKANLTGLLLLQFRRHQSISVSLSDIEIDLKKNQATVTLETSLSGQGGWLGQGRRLQIQSRWLKVDGQWQAERARWQTPTS